MARKNYTVEQIIVKLREVELRCNQGKTIAEACRELGITEQTYYRWRKEYGGMNTSDARRMKELEKENARLKKLVAEQDGSCRQDEIDPAPGSEYRNEIGEHSEQRFERPGQPDHRHDLDDPDPGRRHRRRLLRHRLFRGPPGSGGTGTGQPGDNIHHPGPDAVQPLDRRHPARNNFV